MNKLRQFCLFSCFLSFLVLSFSGCGTREALFDVNAKAEIDIELGMNLIETHNFVKPSIRIPLQATITNLGFKNEDIAETLPFSAIVKPRFGDNINLDFIHAINIYIIDPEQLKRREIFYLDFIQAGTKTEIELLPTLVDITDLLINDLAIVEISIELRQFPPSSFDLCMDMQFSGFMAE